MMPDPLDEFFEETEIIEGEQSIRPRKRRKPVRFLDLLSGLLVAGTIVVGVLCTIIFINPLSKLNPLPPTTMAGQFLTYTTSTTSEKALPDTWTATISPIDTPTSTLFPTDTTNSIVGNSTTPTADLESSVPISKQNSSPTPEADTFHTDAGSSWLGDAGPIDDIDGQTGSTQLAPLTSQTQVASTITAPISTEQFLTQDLESDDGISDLFTPEIQYWEEDILAWGKEYGLDPNLIATVMQIESCGYPKAKSVAGAMGLFQVMPQHFKKKEDPYDPDINASKGLSWLKKTMKSSDSIKMALAAYNAGIARAKDPDLAWPAETRRFVNWGLFIYQDTLSGNDESPALEHWLSKGGTILCNISAEKQQEK